MKISEKLTEDMKTAMKSGEKDKLTVIRMLRAELKNAQIAAGEELSDEQEQKTLQSYAKKRKDSREQALEAGRQEIADKEQAEYDIVMSYLPEQLDEAALTALIEAKGGVYHVSDLRSTNGTFVNETRIERETVLRRGDILRFDRFKYAFDGILAEDDDRTQVSLEEDKTQIRLSPWADAGEDE